MEIAACDNVEVISMDEDTKETLLFLDNAQDVTLIFGLSAGDWTDLSLHFWFFYGFVTNQLILFKINYLPDGRRQSYSLMKTNSTTFPSLLQTFEPFEWGRWKMKVRSASEQEKHELGGVWPQVLEITAPKLLPNLAHQRLFLNLLYRITGYSTAIPKIATIVVIEGDPSHLVYAHVVKSIWTHFLNGAVFTEQGVVQVVKDVINEVNFPGDFPVQKLVDEWMKSVPELPKHFARVTRSVPCGSIEIIPVSADQLHTIETESPLVMLIGHADENGLKRNSSEFISDDRVQTFIRINSPRKSLTPIEALIFCTCNTTNYVISLAKKFPEITMVSYPDIHSATDFGHPVVYFLLCSACFVGDTNVFEQIMNWESAKQIKYPLEAVFRFIESRTQVPEVANKLGKACIHNAEGIWSHIGNALRNKIFTTKWISDFLKTATCEKRWEFIIGLLDLEKPDAPAPITHRDLVLNPTPFFRNADFLCYKCCGITRNLSNIPAHVSDKDIMEWLEKQNKHLCPKCNQPCLTMMKSYCAVHSFNLEDLDSEIDQQEKKKDEKRQPKKGSDQEQIASQHKRRRCT